MKVLLNAPKVKEQKPFTPANFSEARVLELKAAGLDGKTLLQALDILKFKDVEIIVTENGKTGEDILNIGLELENEWLLIGFAKGKDEQFFTDDIGKFQNKFYIRNRMQDGDDPNEPTGPLGISYGAAGVVKVISRRNIDDYADVKPEGARR